MRPIGTAAINAPVTELMKSKGMNCRIATTVPQKQRLQGETLAEKAEHHESRNEGSCKNGVPLAPLGIAGMQAVLKVVLKRRD